MKTTLNQIKSHHPCADGWEKLLQGLGKSNADDAELDVLDILKHNGVRDAMWALRCFEYKEYGLFLADVAESVLHIFQKRHPGDSRPEKAIQAIRDYCKGLIDKETLKGVAYAADAAAVSAAVSAYAAAVSAAYAADAAAYAAADAAGWTNIEQLFLKHFSESENDSQ